MASRRCPSSCSPRREAMIASRPTHAQRRMSRWDRLWYRGITMKTLHLDPAARDQAALVTEEIDRLLNEGKRIAVTVAEEEEFLSPQQTADRLGFSRQHVVRLIGYGELPAEKLPGSNYWKIPLASVLAFEERRNRARELTAEWSRDLDAMSAPLE